MIRPRPYLSYSQMALFEASPERYAEQYIRGVKQRANRNMAYGSLLAEGLERGEATGDPLLDAVAALLPKFELMDVAFEVDLPGGKGPPVRVLAKPDSAKADYSAFIEYKTSTRPWTQRMADQSDQITFYAAAMWLKTGSLPRDIELVAIRTTYGPEGALEPTGDVQRLPTRRTMANVIGITARMRAAWVGIGQLCEGELL